MPIQERQPVTTIQVQIVAVALTITPLIYLLVCFLLQQFVLEEPGGFVQLEESLHLILFFVGLSFGATSLVGGHLIRRVLQAQSAERSLEQKMRIVLVTHAIAESSAVFGLVFFFLTGKLVEASILMAFSLAAHITLFPTQRWLEEE